MGREDRLVNDGQEVSLGTTRVKKGRAKVHGSWSYGHVLECSSLVALYLCNGTLYPFLHQAEHPTQDMQCACRAVGFQFMVFTYGVRICSYCKTT